MGATDFEFKTEIKCKKIKEEMELKLIKVGIEQLNHILKPGDMISYNLNEADELITKSRTILSMLNEQLKIMEEDNNG